MTKRTLPGAPQGRLCANITSQLHARAIDRWNPGVRAAAAADAAEGERTITVYDVIGYDFWTDEGVTAKRVAGALRSMGKGPVQVDINSPGGDMFEGLAIYNLLREHDGEVTVRVLGVAASAASIVAMSGDKIQVARAGFLMVHNAWVAVVGNRHDLADAADFLKPFDDAIAGIYVARTGMEAKAVARLMDAETWIGGEAAIENGFADELLPSDQVEKGAAKPSASAARRVELALRSSGLPKSEAMRLISEFKASAGDPPGSGAGDPTERGAASEAAVAVQATAALRGFSLPTS